MSRRFKILHHSLQRRRDRIAFLICLGAQQFFKRCCSMFFSFLYQCEIYLGLLGLAEECTVIFVLKEIRSGISTAHYELWLFTKRYQKMISPRKRSSCAKLFCETTRYFTGYEMNKVFGSYDGPYLWAFRAVRRCRRSWCDSLSPAHAQSLSMESCGP